VIFRLIERRSGFDTRQIVAAGHAFLRRCWWRLLQEIHNNPRGLLTILVLLNLLNVLDFYLTLWVLANGHQELNPVMRILYGQDTWLAGVFKIGVGVAIAASVWFARKYRRVLAVTLLIFFAYILLIAYHVYGGIRWA
jgi:hypothetical protein